MQTTDDSRVYTVGDVNSKELLTHVAKEQAQRVAANIRADIAGEELRPWEPLTHRVMFSGLGVYSFVRLGLAEDEALHTHGRSHCCSGYQMGRHPRRAIGIANPEPSIYRTRPTEVCRCADYTPL